MSFPAKYEGECAECDGAIWEGDLITFNAQDRVIHEECATMSDVLDSVTTNGKRLTTIGRPPAREVEHPGNPAQTFL